MKYQLITLPITTHLLTSLRQGPPRIHVLIGPRQVGKTTAARQITAELGLRSHFASADLIAPPGPEWIEAEWIKARALSTGNPVLLVLDEVQKVPRWSEQVKRLWDDDVARERQVVPLLLGSSALLLQEGLTESLAGRFQLHRFPHWGFNECRKAFDMSLEEWIYFGGYPGSLPFRHDAALWRSYINDSLIETAISRDLFQTQRINKPALFRQLFGAAVSYPSQVVSYTKLVGLLQDAGNTTTLAHYLTLFESGFLLSGLELFSRGKIRQRASQPKLVAWNNALISAPGFRTFAAAQSDRAWWGRLVENAVGSSLLNALLPRGWSVTYWREGSAEIDFVVAYQDKVWAIEVKSGAAGKVSGLSKFLQKHPGATPLILDSEFLPVFFAQPSLEEFFARSV